MMAAAREEVWDVADGEECSVRIVVLEAIQALVEVSRGWGRAGRGRY
jgi:hypothetical protein